MQHAARGGCPTVKGEEGLLCENRCCHANEYLMTDIREPELRRPCDGALAHAASVPCPRLFHHGHFSHPAGHGRGKF